MGQDGQKDRQTSRQETYAKFAPTVGIFYILCILNIIFATYNHQYSNVILIWAGICIPLHGYLFFSNSISRHAAIPNNFRNRYQRTHKRKTLLLRTVLTALPWSFISTFLIFTSDVDTAKFAVAFGLGMAMAGCTLLVANRKAATLYTLIIFVPMTLAIFATASESLQYAAGIMCLILLSFMIGVIGLLANVFEERSKAMDDLDISKSKIEESSQEIQRIAMLDSLTGLKNRATFFRRLDGYLRVRTETNKGPYALFCIDIDNFGALNDKLGLVAADEVIYMAARRIEDIFDENDLIARLQGDDFAVFIEGVDDATAVKSFTAALINEISGPYHVDGHELHVTCSIGVVTGSVNSMSGQKLLKVAKKSLEYAGRNGPGSHWVLDLDKALANKAPSQQKAA